MSRRDSRRRTAHIKGWLREQSIDRNAGRDYALGYEAAQRGEAFDPRMPAAWGDGWRAAMEPR